MNDKIHKDTLKNRLFHPYDSRSFFKKVFGYCSCPNHKRHWFIYPKTIRMNTRYEEEKSNWVTCCEDFYVSEIATYWEERWKEYYSSVF